jgi:hypothetical protein
MRMYGGVDILIDVSLTLALVGGEWSASCFDHFFTGESPQHRLGGPQSWSGQRGEEKIFDLAATRTPAHWSSSL